MIVREKPKTCSRLPENLDDTPALHEETVNVKIPASYSQDAYTLTFGVVWRPTNVTTGRIAAYAVFDEHTGDTAAGPVFDPRERERLARRLCESLPVWDDDMHPAIVECLNVVARTLLENVLA